MRAHWGRVETDDVPVERLLSNLQAFEAKLQPYQQKDRAHIEFEIGRLHSMAYARKTETAHVKRARKPYITLSYKWKPYDATLMKSIAQNWRDSKNTKSSGIVVRVKISKDGKLLENKIEESSGDDSLDKAALAAIAATKIQPLPDWHKIDSVITRIRFEELLASPGPKMPENLEPFFGHGPATCNLN